MACTRKEWKTFVVAALLLATAAGCASNLPVPAEGGQGKVSANLTGMVTCRFRTILPRDVWVRVELVDISRRDAPARTISMQEVLLEGRQFPIPFEIAYSPSAIDPLNTYAVQARILMGQRLLFANDVVYPVLTNGIQSNVEVVVEPVPGSGGSR